MTCLFNVIKKNSQYLFDSQSINMADLFCVAIRPKCILGYCVCGLHLTRNERDVIKTIIIKIKAFYETLPYEYEYIVSGLLQQIGKKLILQEIDLTCVQNRSQCLLLNGPCLCYIKNLFDMSETCRQYICQLIEIFQSCNIQELGVQKTLANFFERHKSNLLSAQSLNWDQSDCYHNPCYHKRTHQHLFCYDI